MLFAVVELGKDFQEGGDGGPGGQVDVSYEGRSLAAGQIGEDPFHVVTLQAVQQCALLQRVDHGRDALDPMVAVGEPPGDGQTSVTDPASGARLLEGAMKRRVGQGIQRIGEGAGDDFIGQGGERHGRTLAVQAQERIDELGEQARPIRPDRSRRGRGGDRDGCAVDLGPLVGLVPHFQSQHAGSGVGFDQDRETEIGRTGAVEKALVEAGPGQAPDREKRPAIDPGPQIGDQAVLRRPHPASDP